MLRRNKSFVFKVVIFVPLTWLCVVLYMNSSGKYPTLPAPMGPDGQIEYIQDSGRLADEINSHQRAVVDKLPPLKDNQLRKKKLTPPGMS